MIPTFVRCIAAEVPQFYKEAGQHLLKVCLRIEVKLSGVDEGGQWFR